MPTDDDNASITEGRYRLVLIGPSPYVGKRFHIEARSTNGETDTNVEITTPHVSPGETATIEITAKSVDRIRIADTPAIDE